MKKTEMVRFERALRRAGYLDKDGYFFQSDADFHREMRGLTETELKELRAGRESPFLKNVAAGERPEACGHDPGTRPHGADDQCDANGSFWPTP